MTKPTEYYDRDNDNAHAEFQQWRHQNYEGGYFLNYMGPSRIVLHRSACSGHFGDTDWERDREGWGSLTRNKKRCSTDKRELESWASKHGTLALKQCQDCM